MSTGISATSTADAAASAASQLAAVAVVDAADDLLPGTVDTDWMQHGRA